MLLYIWMIVQKVLYLLLFVLAGVLAKKLRLISDDGEKDLSKLLIDFFWPALTFHSIVTRIDREDLLVNWLLPFSAVITALTGLLVASLFTQMRNYQNDQRAVFIYHVMVCNFVFIALPFVEMMIPGKGAGLLFIHNLGYIIVMWVIGVPVLAKKSNFREILQLFLSPVLLATLAGIIVVVLGIQQWIPSLLSSIFQDLGRPTIVVAMIIVGCQLYKMGLRAFRLDEWNIALNVLRLIVVPILLLGIAVLLKPWISRDVLVIFTIVNAMPVSVNAVGMTIRYQSSPEFAAQGVISSHILSIPTIVAHLLLIQYLFYG